ncbi:MAG: methyl-accepting chemotaxis protein [Acidobacteria bacterium]|nr:methyl-accepting chemotaxis protein [Acidobacteriota bacterium]
MNNLQIRVRLILGYSLLILILIAVGGLGIYEMASVNKNLEIIVDKRLAKLDLTRAAISRVQDNGRITMEVFLLKDKTEIDKEIARQEENKLEITKIVEKIEASLEIDKEKSLLTSVKEARKPYVESFSRAVSMVSQGKAEEANAVVLREVLPNLNKFISAWESFIEYQGELTNQAVGESKASYQSSRTLIFVLIFVALVLAGLISVFITRSLTTPINKIMNLFNQIGMGDYDARVQAEGSDEIAKMSETLNAMLDNVLSLIQSQEEKELLQVEKNRIEEEKKLIEKEKEQVEVEKEGIQTSLQVLLEEISDVARGDLTKQAKVTEDVTGAIADAFNFMIVQLRNVIKNVQATTSRVSKAATEIKATAEHLAEGSESQASQIIDTSAAVEEMATSIKHVSENAVLSATVSEQARTNAKQGAEVVRKTISGMNNIRQQVQETAKRIKRLGESSQEIGEIVQLISDIADRTSILALNASIQAAMAGDAGRGFGVVAAEVERLAERSAQATKRIETLIKSVQSETKEAISSMESTTREVVLGSELANEAGKSLSEIEVVSNRLAELMQSISMAAKQQARGSESINSSMNTISDITQQTASGTKQAASSMKELSKLAEDLRSSVSTFKISSNGNSSTHY